MSDIRQLLDLLATVPILHVDVSEARARGDHEAARYAAAIAEWQAKAERILEEAEAAYTQRRDAYQRAAIASELARL